MVLFRALAVLLAVAFLLCMAMASVTGQAAWRQRARQAMKWGVVLALCFFGLVILRRAAVFI